MSVLTVLAALQFCFCSPVSVIQVQSHHFNRKPVLSDFSIRQRSNCLECWLKWEPSYFGRLACIEAVASECSDKTKYGIYFDMRNSLALFLH